MPQIYANFMLKHLKNEYLAVGFLVSPVCFVGVLAPVSGRFIVS